MQTLAQYRFRLEIHRRALLGDRVLEVGDVVDVNPVTGEVFVAAPLPYNPDGLRSLMADGIATPAEGTAPEAVARLEGSGRRTKPAQRTHLRLVTTGGDA